MLAASSYISMTTMNKPKLRRQSLNLLLTLSLILSSASSAAEDAPLLIRAARIFDGYTMRNTAAVLISDGKISAIGDQETLKDLNANTLDLGDATLLPGFIELHAHLGFQQVPAETVLRHGITSLRDVGGPLHQPYGGKGQLRVLTSGPILTAAEGYPIPSLGATDIAIPVTSAKEGREKVRELINGGAVVIKIALEPGGEIGAPWSSSHGHGHSHQQPAAPAEHRSHATAIQAKPSWPMLTEAVVKAIVDQAHQQGRKVSAHLAEARGVQLANKAGVDEWAHMPCAAIPQALLKQAVAQNVKIVTTLDTLSKCPGIAENTQAWAALGGELLYGAEIAHPDIPWGIDSQELGYIMHLAELSPLDVMRLATSKAGQYLNIPLLGTLQAEAPADLIAVKGDPSQKLKLLEYPDLVISGGKVVVNHFAK